ncbi:MAG: energy transducer TonB [Acidobacteriia bacterium]|nr:energy transducer TonB [Terriglobia bacterium]
MSSPAMRWVAASLFAVLSWMVVGSAVVRPLTAAAEDHEEPLTRKVKSKVAPAYPDVARRMSIAGTVKVMVVVAPNGSIKSTKVVGGHPLLVNAVLEALKKWRFEPGPDENTGIVEFKFQPPE